MSATLLTLLKLAASLQIAVSVQSTAIEYVDESACAYGVLAVAAYNGEADAVVVCKPDSNGVYTLIDILSDKEGQ